MYDVDSISTIVQAGVLKTIVKPINQCLDDVDVNTLVLVY